MTMHERLTLYPPIEPYRNGLHGCRRRPHDVFRGMRQPARPAGAAGARRSRRRLQSDHAPLPRPGPLPHHPVRPARLRPLDPARLARGQYNLASRRRHGAAARGASHRALAAVRRLVGIDAGAGLCRGASRARNEPHPARHLPRAPRGARMVLPAGLQLDLSGCLRGIRERHPAGRARRHDQRLP